MKKHFYVYPSLLVVGVLLLSGCDQVKAIKDYFTGNKAEEKASVESEKALLETAPTAAPTALGPNEVARVGKWAITAEEMKERMLAVKEALKDRNPNFNPDDPQNKLLVRDQLIQQELVFQDAEKKGLAKSKDVQRAVEEFRRQLVVQQALAEMVKNLTVTDQETQAFYDQNKEKIVEPGDWHLREILVETQAEAEKIRSEVVGGADFAQTAQNKSKSPTAAAGGDLGFIAMKDIPSPAMLQALMALKVGDVSPVFPGDKGFYILKLEEQKPSRPMSFEEVKEEIKQNLLADKQRKELESYLQKLQAGNPPQVNENLLKN